MDLFEVLVRRPGRPGDVASSDEIVARLGSLRPSADGGCFLEENDG